MISLTIILSSCLTVEILFQSDGHAIIAKYFWIMDMYFLFTCN